jgi:hypothetical protein
VALPVAVGRAELLARPRALARVTRLPVVWAIGGLVAVSFVVRLVLGTLRPTPVYLPDEFLYAELARGLAEHGRPVVHGVTAPFPALLEPLLAAPFWLAAEPELAYRLTQGLHALAMSLAVVPVYALARRLGLSRGYALGAGALAVATPDLVYASWILAEPIAYPLALGAVYAGVRALAAPTARSQLAFVALAGLATFARVQYAALPVAFAVAALAVERWRPLVTVRRFRVMFALLALPLAGVAAAGPQRVLGPYVGVFIERVDPAGLGGWMGTNALLLAYAAGWVLVPAALVGLACGLVRPRSREEAGFAGLTVALALLLLLQAAFVAEFDSERFHERYLFVLLPLAAIAAALGSRPSRRAAQVTAGLALGLFVLAVRVPIAEFLVADGRADSPTLLALYPLQRAAGVGNTALVVSLVAAVLSLLAVAAAFRPRWGATAGLVATGALAVTLSAGVAVWSTTEARAARAAQLPTDASWVDHARLGSVALVVLPYPDRLGALGQLFWNRSVDDVLRLPRVKRLDAFRHREVRIARDGRLVAGDEVVRKPLLVQRTGSTLELAGATRVAQTPAFDLWRPGDRPRVALLAEGRAADTWLRALGKITLWPNAAGRTRGRLRLELELPRGAEPTTIRFRGSGIDRQVQLRPGGRAALVFSVDAAGPWSVRWSATRLSVLGGLRVVAAKAPVLRFEP